MSRVAVRVERVGKRYRIGAQRESYARLTEVVSRSARSAARRLLGDAPPAAPRTIWALRDVSFDVGEGEVLGIIGRNGAGKSTLLKVLSRITPPTEGRITVRGRVGSLLEVGTGFHPELTGRENIYLNGTILGMRRAEVARKFDEIVAFSGVEQFLDTPVKRYSSGMYVRLAFAVAAHLEPEILVIDEVLAVGDAAFQERCLNKMRSIATSGRTVLFVSHNMPAVRALCTRAILIDGGRVLDDGTPTQVIGHYLFSGDVMRSARVWEGAERPGNHSFRVTSVRITDARGEDMSVAPISQDILVEIGFEALGDSGRAQFALTLFDQEGTCAFSSLSNHEPHFHGRPLPAGAYVTTCRIPGDTLNSGRFTATIVGCGEYWSDAFTLDHIVAFETVDDGLLKGDYAGSYGGLLRPRLAWRTVQAPNRAPTGREA